MIIAIRNESTRVSDDEASKIAEAVQLQMDLHVAPMYDRMPPKVVFVKDAIPEGECVLNLKDAISDPNAIGYHTEGVDGSYWGDIAVSPVLDNGGGVLVGANGYSVASVVSHEAIELFVDQAVNVWVDGPTSQYGACYAQEAADPVEAQSYSVTLTDGTVVQVSNFVGPKWFDEMAPSGSQLDYLGRLTKPFTLDDGGYCVVRFGPGTEQQIFGEVAPPAWRLAMKKAGRTARRKKAA